jgi:hypothetical protein
MLSEAEFAEVAETNHGPPVVAPDAGEAWRWLTVCY